MSISNGKVIALAAAFGGSGGGGTITTNNLVSVERLGEYLYKATFDSIPEYKEGNATPTGCCSAFVRDGKLYRNFDWQYDDTASFYVVCKDFEGIASIVGLKDGMLDKRVEQLPYHLVDGVNKYGIMVSTHVLFNDFGYTGSGNKDKRIMGLPYYILSNVTDMGRLGTQIREYIENLNVPPELAAMEYLVQFIVTDGTTTKVITPKSDGTEYEIVDASSNPKLTNFKWVADLTVDRADLQDKPTGVERWNSINNLTDNLAELRFTKAYESPDRLSEFIGIDGTTKDSTDEELTEIYNLAHNEYLIRERDGKTWQTVHSVVYNGRSVESLCVQENYNKDYALHLGEIVDVGSNQYVYNSYSLPAIDRADLQRLYDNYVTGREQVVKWTLLGSETYLKIVSADKISGNYSIDVVVHNSFHCAYTWNNETSGLVNPEVLEADVATLSGTDLNGVTATGFYSCDVCTNRPTECNGTLLVVQMQKNSRPVTQMYQTFGQNRLFIRQMTSNVWGVWVEMSPERFVSTIPASASADGVVGQYSVDSNYLYMCVAANTWKRVALESW